MITAGTYRYKVRICPHGNVRAGATYIAGDSQDETDAHHSVETGRGRVEDWAEAPTLASCAPCKEEQA